MGRQARKNIEGWIVIDAHHLEKEFRFEDYKSAISFVNRVGLIAEEQNHHPDVYMAWGSVKLKIWTHTVDGLTDKDYALAAGIDAICPSL